MSARLTIALLVVHLTFAAVTAQEADASPLPSGLVEEAGVRLMLLDVEVRDKDGRPIPGLVKEDFEVLLNGRSWTIYSVDDLCACGAEPQITGSTGESDASTGEVDAGESIPDDADPPSAPNPAETVKFVLYLDFSQLQLGSRAMAIQVARDWVRETMQTGDEALLVGYVSTTGLHEIVPFTSDKQALLAGLDACEKDMALLDSFPTGLFDRQRHVASCCEDPDCCCQCLQDRYGREEYSHGRGGIKALTQLMITLESVPGRKALLLFHQNGTLFPARYYGAQGSRIGDHNTLLDELAAEATLARTSVHVAYSGPGFQFSDGSSNLNINLGANLADYTGGTYNKTSGQLVDVVHGAGRGCSCLYRIGLEPPDRSRRPYRVTVIARERKLDHRYRVQYLSRFDRWLRDARSVLRKPEAAVDLDVGVAIVPVGATRKRGWDLAVRIVLDLDSLALIPDAGKHQGDWEVGALLNVEPKGKNWDMLGVSRVRSGDPEIDSTMVIHERTFQALKAGRYHLAAFVRDRVADGFGGAQTWIDLPAPKTIGIAGPIVTRGGQPYLFSSLPLWGGKTSESRPGHPREGHLPQGGVPVARGNPLEMLSWLCTGKKDVEITGLLSYVAHEGKPLYRLQDPEITDIGDCYRVRDTVDTRPLTPGAYTYRIRWTPDGEEPCTGQAEFEIAPVEPTEEAAAVETETTAGDP